jgi:hypothetical protein
MNTIHGENYNGIMTRDTLGSTVETVGCNPVFRSLILDLVVHSAVGYAFVAQNE